MVGDDAANYRQAKAGTRFFCGKVRLEKTWLIFWSNSMTVIGNRDASHIERRVENAFDIDGSFPFDGGYCIVEKVDKDPFYLVAIKGKLWD